MARLENLVISRYSFIYIFFMLLIYSIYVAFPLSMQHLRFIAIEHGLIENMTVVFYFVTIVVCIIIFAFKKKIGLLHHLILISILLARELDCHKTLVGKNVLKIKFYFSSETNILTRISTAIIVGILALYVIYYAYRYTKTAWRNLKKHVPYMYTLSFVFCILIVVRLTETIKTILRNIYSIDRINYYNLIFEYVEECGEMMIPVLLGLAIIQFSKMKQQDTLESA